MALPNALNTYNFPDAYDSLVDAFTGTIKYISASTGSNGNTGNSVGAAYLTIDYALAQNTSGTATMFVILEGTYTLTPTSVNGSSVGLTDGGNHREFVCAPGKVIIQHTASGADRDSAIFNMGNINSKIYGAIIKRNNNGRTTNYTVAYFRFNSAKGNFYNCVFSETNANNAWSYQYDNYGYNNLALRNCTFYHLAAPSGNYTNAGTCLTIDSVFNTTVTTGGTETNVLKSQTVNATTYATTGVTTAGVYSGTYAWNGATTFDPGFVAPATVVSGNTINLVYYHTSSSATVAYTITGVITADINGTALTGNMTVTNSSATLSIPTTQFSSGGAKTLTITAGAYSASVSITPRLFIRSATGGTQSLVTVDGRLYRAHRFNSSANFTISNADAGAVADILIVAGGGSGGNHSTTNANGGGGAGGVLRGTATLAAGTYAVVVGAGGTAIANSTALNGVKGTNSSLGSYIAEGGGGGGSSGVAFSSAAQNGGSGGGNALNQSGGGVANANATAGSLSVLGFNGGSTSASYTGAGGGGAGAAGVNGSGSNPGGNGGIGITNTWTGSTLYLAGGGGGSGNSSERAGDGFYGGGRGAGTTTYYSYNVYTNEVNATTRGSGIPTAVVNTGGGGGGGSYWAPNGGWSTGSGAGGSGIVIVSYEAAAGFSAPTSVASGSTIDISYVHTASSGAVAYTITGVTSADINGNSLSGNMTVTNSSATLSIPTAVKVATTNTLTVTAGAYSISVTITPSFTCEALIIAGGGSGGNHNTTNANGGGGAGGVLQGTVTLAASASYAVVVGAGGTAIANATALNGVKGTDSSLGSYIAEGGGGGGSSGVAFSSAAQNGGSGGGNAYYQSGGGLANANATAGSLTSLGYNGGQTSSTWTGAGGGGAGAAGVNGSGSSPGGNGGIGITNTWTGSTLYLAGGGGGGGNSSERAGDGFYGGGRGAGTTTYYSYTVYTNEINTTTRGSGIPTAVVNTGGGGGGGSYWAPNGGWSTGSGAGGSGRVLIRYAGTPKATGGTITQSGGYTIHQFLTAGTFTTPTAGITSSHPTTAYWGEIITFTYVDDLADASTVAYTISGVTSEQISGGSLSGNFTFSGSIAIVTVTLSIQSTNTTGTMTFVSGATTFTVSISNLVSFTSDKTGTYWGGSLTLTALTKGLSSGGVVPYTISGVTSAQISNTSLTGNLTVSAVSSNRSGQYSNYFDGTGDTLSIPSPTTGLSFGTGEFTIEMWVYKTSAENDGLLDARSSAAATPWFLGIDGSNFPYFYDGTSYISSVAVTLNSWSHVAVVRTSGVLKIFVNGVQGYSASYGTNLDRTAGLVIGDTIHAAAPLLGYISNLRIVKGTAVYNSAFTPPTLSLTAITGTSLLTCRSSRIIDLSTNNHTITVNGNTSVNSFNPVPTTFSNYFDGTGDYLTLPNNAFDLTSTTTWSIEYWIYPTTIASGYYGLWACSSNGLRQGIYTDSGTHYITVLNGGGGVGTMNLTADNKVVTLNHWQHIALTSDGTTIRQFYNGVLKGTGSAASFSSSTPTIGSWGSANTFAGYISNFRIVKGTAVYTSAFTPPTQPLVTITNTSLLTCQSNRFVDNSTNQFIITTAGNSAINSFNPNEFAYSNYFDGTGDDLSLTITGGLGSGNFTLEYWFYPTSLYNYITTFCTTRGANGFNVGTDSAGLLVWYSSSARQIQGGTIISNRWHHAAFVRSGSTLTGYLNGVSIGTATVTTDFSATAARIGSLSGGGEYITGYLSNLRVVKGTAVYTSNFVPPTESLTAIENTSLLTCQSNRFIDNSTNNFTITKNGDARIDGFIPDISLSIPSPNGIASLSIITNPSEPILNSATMVTAITGGSITNQIRTGNPAVFQTYKPSLVSLAYIDTEITDIHSEALEARVSSLVDIGSRVNPVQFSTTVTNIVYIDTEITDIHSEALEAKVSSVSDLNAKLHVIKSDTSIAGFVAAPTFAYSSGEDVKVSASATQTWYI